MNKCVNCGKYFNKGEGIWFCSKECAKAHTDFLNNRENFPYG